MRHIRDLATTPKIRVGADGRRSTLGNTDVAMLSTLETRM
jgi:hypothetical protein